MVASHRSELGHRAEFFSPGGPQAWGQGQEADTRAVATATRTLLSPEQLLLICGERGKVSDPPFPRWEAKACLLLFQTGAFSEETRCPVG